LIITNHFGGKTPKEELAALTPIQNKVTEKKRAEAKFKVKRPRKKIEKTATKPRRLPRPHKRSYQTVQGQEGRDKSRRKKSN